MLLGEKKNNKLTPAYYIAKRKSRAFIKGTKFLKFTVGDILEFIFFSKNIPLIFSGICIAIKRKNFIVADTMILIRNIIFNTIIEIIASYFYNRIYKLKFLDFRRKFYVFNKNKLYYIRNKVNRKSKVG